MSIVIATNMFTNRIYAGKTLKHGIFGNDKQDVTIDALFAVADHVLNNKSPVVLSVEGDGGELIQKYKITVEQL